MNKTIAAVGGIIIIAVVGAIFFFNNQGADTTSPTATSTPSTGTTPVTQGDVQTRTAGAPVVTTNATVAPTDTTAVVTGTVVPMGAMTTYWYEYGTSQSLGSKTGGQTVGSGYAAIPTPGYLTGLTKNSTYYFRLVAENSYGRVAGAQNAVRTTEGTPAPVGGLPSSKTLAATNVSRTSANLKGEVNPNKAATTYWFEYGTTSNFGDITSFTSAGNGSGTVPASATLANLDPATTYYFRLNSQNQFGTVNGATLTFKTSGPAASAPSVDTRPATNIGTNAAKFRGTVDPNGAETTYWFEYSNDSLLGAVLLKTTARASAGSGTTSTSVEADVSQLISDMTYYVRIVAQNSQGIVRGDIESFKTNR